MSLVFATWRVKKKCVFFVLFQLPLIYKLMVELCLIKCGQKRLSADVLVMNNASHFHDLSKEFQPLIVHPLLTPNSQLDRGM